MTLATYVLFGFAHFFPEIAFGLTTPGSVSLLDKGVLSYEVSPLLLPRGAYPRRPFEVHRMKNLSMEEASLSCSDVSSYGAAVPKLSARIISQVTELKRNITSKIHNYNFQGTMYAPPSVWVRRKWVEPFAKEHFTDNDIIIFSDEVAKQHDPLGPYDHTQEIDGWRAKDHIKEFSDHFQSGYWRRMIQSNFTLAPGGDHPWSMRFYEAILAGSIPVINAIETDLSDRDIGYWFRQIGYTYFTTDQLAKHSFSSGELKEIANKNYELFVKYQTWLQGDNIPPAYSMLSGLCSSSSTCMRQCMSYF